MRTPAASEIPKLFLSPSPSPSLSFAVAVSLLCRRRLSLSPSPSLSLSPSPSLSLLRRRCLSLFFSLHLSSAFYYLLSSRCEKKRGEKRYLVVVVMGCFPCGQESIKKTKKKDQIIKTSPSGKPIKTSKSVDAKKEGSVEFELSNSESEQISAHTFAYRELVAATKNFRGDCFLGEGGFGKVYKGRLESSNQIVAIKQLDRNGLQGNREFLVEVLMLSLLHHPNLVNLIGYCADGDQRLLVYEFMALGSLEDHLYDFTPERKRLDWNTRMKIAAGAAKGLEYLHDKATPPVIFRDLKCSNILLGDGYQPKLSDFGLAKLAPVGDNTHVSTRVMGTYGYCAPEYAMTGQLTIKSDIYSFGVVLLELITGRRAIDSSRTAGEQNLVAWARPLFKDRRKFSQMADPVLQSQYPVRGLYQALAVAAMCVQEQPAMRPLIADVVTALTYLASQLHNPQLPPNQTTPRFTSFGTPPRTIKGKRGESRGSDRSLENTLANY